MIAVALETSTRRGSVAARAGESLLFEELGSARAHASDLIPSIDRLLGRLGVAPAEVQAVFVGTGPGSYTGLRIGVATALGIARGTGAELRGVPSGEVLVYSELPVGGQGIVLLDARSNEFYLAHYRRDERDVETLRAPGVHDAEELRELLGEEAPIFGDETVASAAHLSAQHCARLRVDAVPRADALLELGALRLARHGPHTPAELEPLYLRPFAAALRRR